MGPEFEAWQAEDPYVSGDNTTRPPSGSDIWDKNVTWSTIRSWHPAGVISNVYDGAVIWADVSYMSMNGMLVLSIICYPAIPIALIMATTVLLSVCLQAEQDRDYLGHVESPRARDAVGSSLAQPPAHVLPTERLSRISQIVYYIWTSFCCTIPSIFVFGVPLLLVGLSRPYPEEVFSILTLVTTAMAFSNGAYMVVFSAISISRMRQALNSDYGSMLQKFKASREPALQDSSQEVTHWVVVPQYKEDIDIVAMTLRSMSQSRVANVSVVLGMELRESGSREKAEALQARFAGQFKEIFVSYHPAGLPNDPPGKASNVAWAFNVLMQHIQSAELDLSKVLLTIADADSEFHTGYFDALTLLYLQAAERRNHTIWQSPVFHVKNYHRQPMPVIVGTVFTCMQELAALSDPNAIRFPYSTYSLTAELAFRVGGWDPEWIAEDWHMGIKCFLFTYGQTTVEPLMLPTANYTPEDSTYWSTVDARWSQAKRHALGFSDLTYYFMMLPLVFGHAAAARVEAGHIASLRKFWSMAALGVTLVIKLVNVHVIIGVLMTYGLISYVLKLAMFALFSADRRIWSLVDRTHLCELALSASIGSCMLIVTLFFLAIYELVKSRIEGKAFRWRVVHWCFLAASFLICGPFYFLGLGIAVLRAASIVIFTRTFEYEVAKKPAPAAAEPGQRTLSRGV